MNSSHRLHYGRFTISFHSRSLPLRWLHSQFHSFVSLHSIHSVPLYISFRYTHSFITAGTRSLTPFVYTHSGIVPSFAKTTCYHSLFHFVYTSFTVHSIKIQLKYSACRSFHWISWNVLAAPFALRSCIHQLKQIEWIALNGSLRLASIR